VKKFLFIKIGALGDLSYALPAAGALKQSLTCHLTWVVGKTNQYFLKGHPFVDRLVIVDDNKLYSKSFIIRLIELTKLYFRLHQRFDSVLIAHRDAIYYRAFKLLARDRLFQIVRKEVKEDPQFVYIKPLSIHESLAIKQLVEKAIQYYIPQKMNIGWVWDYSYIKHADINLPEKYIVFHLGGGVNAKTEFRLKCWPYWEELILTLMKQTNIYIVFVGASSEKFEYERIIERVNTLNPEKSHHCIDFVGKTTIPELVDIIRRCDVFVGVDSGPLHIADSMNKITLGLYGPTSPVSWGLLSENATLFHATLPCSPCYLDDGYFPECQYQNQCMKLLDVNRIFDAINSSIL
jgi:ADP-heptose:LPS heptosyltransferase